MNYVAGVPGAAPSQAHKYAILGSYIIERTSLVICDCPSAGTLDPIRGVIRAVGISRCTRLLN